MHERESGSLMKAARKLAAANAKSEPEIVEIYLFPSETEIRLVELDRTAIPSEQQIIAFYFNPDPAHGVPYPTGIAVVPPDEKNRVPPPDGWGSWKDAQRIWPRTAKA